VQGGALGEVNMGCGALGEVNMGCGALGEVNMGCGALGGYIDHWHDGALGRESI